MKNGIFERMKRGKVEQNRCMENDPANPVIPSKSSPHLRSLCVNPRLILFLGLLAFAVGPIFSVQAQAPAWWTSRHVLNTNAVPNDFAAVNQGQVKWLATQAALELDSDLQHVGGAGAGIETLIATFSPTNNYLPVNLGQIKNVAKPFYDRLWTLALTNCYPKGAGTPYPWSNSLKLPNDYAMANIGQAKYAFSFDTAVDSDADGIPDIWECDIGSDPYLDDAYDSSTNLWAHGLNNLQVYQNPSVLNADGFSTLNDGVPDWWKLFHGFLVMTSASTVAPNGQTLAENYQNGTDPNDTGSGGGSSGGGGGEPPVVTLMSEVQLCYMSKEFYFPAYQQVTNIPQFYLQQVTTWNAPSWGIDTFDTVFIGGPVGDNTLGPGTKTEIYARSTGELSTVTTGSGSITCSAELLGANAPTSVADEFWDLISFDVEYDYDGTLIYCASSHVYDVTMNLSEEYTTAMLKEDANNLCPGFTGNFQEDGDCSASWEFDAEEEAWCSLQKLQYKFQFSPAASNLTIQWREIFTPHGEYDASSTNLLTWTGSGAETPVFTIDPYQRAPDQYGTYTVETPDIFKVDIAMDGNRDDTIDFYNPADQKYLFWVNDDHDVISSGEEDDVSDGTKDCDDNVIACKRDLEDFARLHLQVGSTITNLPGVTYWLKFENVTQGAPAVNVFEAVDDSLSYLQDSSSADEQIQKQNLTPGGVSNTEKQIDGQYINTEDGISPFILEGKSAGKGDLVFIVKKGGQEIARKSIHLDLRPITAFYEKYVVTVSTGDDVNTTDDGNANSTIYTPETDEYVLHVHGWNMADWEKDRWTETVFKRLWWQRYKGHVGSFQWPTYTGWSTYDASELRAWRSGEALKNRVASLNATYSGQVRVLAHSMGNVVMGEALRLFSSSVVHTYIAAQAAIPAHCYDNAIGNYWTGFNTPNIYARYSSGLSPDTPYLAANSSHAGAMVTYFNTNDYALGWWETGNEMKPDYAYWNTDGDSSIDSYIPISGDRFSFDNVLVPFDERTLTIPENRFEIFARIVESRSKALGRVSSVSGFGTARNLQDWGYDKERYSHSKEFRSNVATEWLVWDRLFRDAQLSR